jgi:hypothetical protein
VANDPVNFGDPSGLLMLPRISEDIGIDYSGFNSCDGEMWPDGGDGFIPMSFACMNPPANPTGRGEFGNGGGSNIKPWERRKPVVDILRAKNPCSDWFNQGTGSAANVMSQVAIVLYTSKDPYPDMPDANTGESPQTPIYVNSLAHFIREV